MNKNIINFEEKRKDFRAKPYIESGLLMHNISGILDDLEFFKKNVELIKQSDNLFKFSIKKNKNYSKSVMIQHKFVEKFKKSS